MRMSHVTLRPHIMLEPGADEARARELVEKAHQDCFVANSTSATVVIEPRVEMAAAPAATE
jgi:organic hydroperoxide reductase OsmC/OhrA